MTVLPRGGVRGQAAFGARIPEIGSCHRYPSPNTEGQVIVATRGLAFFGATFEIMGFEIKKL
ncbi:hypothetical protein [Caballeronia zhejiangensis]|uniref:hypothetical protein n=1 Tax=Caballeronia zhejiangensis TaxID=871203 RepID=UPI001FD4335C|nr:hypothetical protein [Caballeronia zhejiangensis]